MPHRPQRTRIANQFFMTGPPPQLGQRSTSARPKSRAVWPRRGNSSPVCESISSFGIAIGYAVKTALGAENKDGRRGGGMLGWALPSEGVSPCAVLRGSDARAVQIHAAAPRGHDENVMRGEATSDVDASHFVVASTLRVNRLAQRCW
jgi:hypothetical protein